MATFVAFGSPSKMLRSTTAAYGSSKAPIKWDCSIGKLNLRRFSYKNHLINQNSFVLMLFSFVRMKDENGKIKCDYDKPGYNFPREQFTPCPVKAGSLVLIHGLVIHMSDANLSDKRRCAFTFHVMETEKCKYVEENWLKLQKHEKFPELY